MTIELLNAYALVIRKEIQLKHYHSAWMISDGLCNIIRELTSENINETTDTMGNFTNREPGAGSTEVERAIGACPERPIC